MPIDQQSKKLASHLMILAINCEKIKGRCHFVLQPQYRNFIQSSLKQILTYYGTGSSIGTEPTTLPTITLLGLEPGTSLDTGT